MFEVGQKVHCNGYIGTITAVCTGQLKGMYEVRLDRGGVCVDGTTLRAVEKPAFHIQDWNVRRFDQQQGCWVAIDDKVFASFKEAHDHLDANADAYRDEHGVCYLHVKRAN